MRLARTTVPVWAAMANTAAATQASAMPVAAEATGEAREQRRARHPGTGRHRPIRGLGSLPVVADPTAARSRRAERVDHRAAVGRRPRPRRTATDYPSDARRHRRRLARDARLRLRVFLS